MRQRSLVALFYLILVGAFAAGVWASYRAAFPERGLYRVVGSLQARHGEAGILIRHESVPGLMDEMDLMSLDVESRDLLERAAVQPGDRVRVTVRQFPGRLVVTEIQRLP
jgi:Copper binding periplasmic protein CusF